MFPQAMGHWRVVGNLWYALQPRSSEILKTDPSKTSNINNITYVNMYCTMVYRQAGILACPERPDLQRLQIVVIRDKTIIPGIPCKFLCGYVCIHACIYYGCVLSSPWPGEDIFLNWETEGDSVCLRLYEDYCWDVHCGCMRHSVNSEVSHTYPTPPHKPQPHPHPTQKNKRSKSARDQHLDVAMAPKAMKRLLA